jgi:hypothetical protein
MDSMPMSEEVTGTRKELAEQLAVEKAEKQKLEERLARLEAAFAANQETDEQRKVREKRLAEAEAELMALRPAASQPYQPPTGKRPDFKPYKGWVRALVDCTYDGYRFGPHPDQGRTYGDVFEIDVPTLWSDDPFEPVEPRWDEQGNLIEVKVRKDVVRVNHRWRQRAPDMGLLAANQI